MRVWSLPAGRLVRVMRAPGRESYERMNSVAFVGDDRLAVGCGRFIVMYDMFRRARRALLASLGHRCWHRLFVEVDGDHAIAARVVGFL